ncbi:hypothetical protein MMC18_001420 [Xylographa bjoerkii]|nr:hypothetical protein [Xylographa bjoerkii]
MLPRLLVPSTSLADEASRTDDGTLPGPALSEGPVMNAFQLQSSGGDDFPSLDLTMQESLLDELVTFDGLLGSEDHSAAQHQVFADVCLHSPLRWFWTATAVLVYMDATRSRSLDHDRESNDEAKCEFEAGSSGGASTRSTQRRPYHSGPTDLAHDDMYHMSGYELLAAAQACMIYLIMFLVEYSPELEEDGKELIQIYALSSRRCVYLSVRANLPTQAPIGNIGSMPNPAKGSQLYGSSSAALCLRKPAILVVLYKAVVVSCFLAQNPSGRHPRNLLGSRSTRLAAFFKQVD